MRRITIAIDGYSSCGKSTLAKQLAHHLHYTYIDSGAMYRAIALYVIENGLVVDGQLNLTALLRVLNHIHIGFHFLIAGVGNISYIRKHVTRFHIQYQCTGVVDAIAF